MPHASGFSESVTKGPCRCARRKKQEGRARIAQRIAETLPLRVASKKSKHPRTVQNAISRTVTGAARKSSVSKCSFRALWPEKCRTGLTSEAIRAASFATLPNAPMSALSDASVRARPQRPRQSRRLRRSQEKSTQLVAGLTCVTSIFCICICICGRYLHTVQAQEGKRMGKVRTRTKMFATQMRAPEEKIMRRKAAGMFKNSVPIVHSHACTHAHTHRDTNTRTRGYYTHLHLHANTKYTTNTCTRTQTRTRMHTHANTHTQTRTRTHALAHTRKQTHTHDEKRRV